MDDGGAEDETSAVCGIVLRMPFERWPDLKRAIRAMGGTILYERTRPRGTILWIVEKQRDRDGPVGP